MITKKGTILSSISSIANSDADKNYILIKNIFEEPIEEIFKAYLVNFKTKSIEEQFDRQGHERPLLCPWHRECRHPARRNLPRVL